MLDHHGQSFGLEGDAFEGILRKLGMIREDDGDRLAYITHHVTGDDGLLVRRGMVLFGPRHAERNDREDRADLLPGEDRANAAMARAADASIDLILA
jgi:hypothetical protein